MNTEKREAIIRIYKPNIVSVIWILICLKTAVPFDSMVGNIAYYSIIGVALWYSIYSIIVRNYLTSIEMSLIILFAVLIGLQLIGLVQVFSLFSFTNIFASICILFFLDCTSFSVDEIQIVYLRIGFFCSSSILLVSAFLGNVINNTVSGCLVFMTSLLLVAESTDQHDSHNNQSINHIKKPVSYVCSFIAVIIAVTVCYISASRTALFSLIIILMFMLFFGLSHKASSWYRLLFWIIVAFIIIGCFIYANIHEFSWYSLLDSFSVKMFGKSIDTSRPFLWKESFGELKWWQVIVGAGTGKLPSIERYATSSFHNSYLQLIMQNGLIGLSILISIFWLIWKKITYMCCDFQQRMVLASFAGIIIYNSFEVTLLQNKAFLGMIEWMILSLGLIRNRNLVESNSGEIVEDA